MPYVIGRLRVWLGCRACHALERVSVAVLWDGADGKPRLDDGAELDLWTQAHRDPYAVAR